MSTNQSRLTRATVLAALGVASFAPAAGATINFGSDRPAVVIERMMPEFARYQANGNSHRDNRGRSVERRAIRAFFKAGYDYDHAVSLADYWGYDDPTQAKITKGKVLLGLIDFPPSANIEDQALNAYFEAGLDYDHAVELAELWGYDDPATAKIVKGKFLLGVIDDLPPFGGHEDNLEVRAVEAFFEAGYDYEDAVLLADFWGSDDPYWAKVAKGKFLLGVADLPPAADDVTPVVHETDEHCEETVEP